MPRQTLKPPTAFLRVLQTSSDIGFLFKVILEIMTAILAHFIQSPVSIRLVSSSRDTQEAFRGVRWDFLTKWPPHFGLFHRLRSRKHNARDTLSGHWCGIANPSHPNLLRLWVSLWGSYRLRAGQFSATTCYIGVNYYFVSFSKPLAAIPGRDHFPGLCGKRQREVQVLVFMRK